MIDIIVLGIPATQGSKTGIPFARKNADGSPKLSATGKPVLGLAMTEGTKDKAEHLRSWRSMIAVAASMKLQEAAGSILDGPVIVEATFYLPRPKNAAKKIFPAARPDLDKLQRAVGDALAGVAYTDDSRIVDWVPRKRFADNWDAGRPGVAIRVRPATEADL